MMNRLLEILEGRTYRLRLKIWDIVGDDTKYLKCMFFHRLGYKLNMDNPQSFNEKLQWMKLYDHNPKYSEYADKYAVRKHISEVMGEQYLIPLIAVYDNPDQIDFESLPNRFVLKCNHGASYNIICDDKRKLDIDDTKKKLSRWLSTDFGLLKREYHYQNIKRKIVCEQFMEDNETKGLLDYKLFCINGKVHMIQVDIDRFGNHRRNIYDPNWKLLDVSISYPNDPSTVIEKPKVFNEMIMYAEILSKEFKQVRIDFFVINGKLYFGEMTFFSGAGFSRYDPREFEFKMGEKISLK